MTIEVAPPRIQIARSPREVLVDRFELAGQLPIRGGWGYSIEDAVEIDRCDPIVPPDVSFHGVGVEYAYVEKRIYLELIVLRSPEDWHAGIEWNLLEQRLLEHEGKKYDLLRFEVISLRDKDWQELKARWEAPNGYGSPGFDERAHIEEHEAKTIRYITEYWFDISSFFGVS